MTNPSSSPEPSSKSLSSSPPVVSAEAMASPYGSFGGGGGGTTTPTNEPAASSVFRNWSSSPSRIHNNDHTDVTTAATTTTAVAKLTEQTDSLRNQLHELREHGRQIRLHRLQALDALETRRITLTEILRRMEKELNDRDVYEYGDVLAEVFGERKIFAHRAVGLEALLCQYMHQMLAKQHQLKIMKQAGKDIQSHYKKNRLRNKDDYYSYEALTVQLEASRLSLEAVYDDIFAAQHSMLAKLKYDDVESSGGKKNVTNYSLPTTTTSTSTPKSTKTTKSNEDQLEDVTSQLSSLATMTPSANALVETTNSHHNTTTSSINNFNIIPSFRTPNTDTHTTSLSSTTTKGSGTGSGAGGGVKSARERRREIEQKRLARPTTITMTNNSTRGNNSSNSSNVQDSSSLLSSPQEGARSRMRELESAAAINSTAVSGVHDDENDADDGGDKDGELMERKRVQRKVVSTS